MPDSKTIAVQAVVPLTPEFAYSIRKNSSLASEKTAFAFDEEVRVQVRIVGGNDEPLRGHAVRLWVVGASGGEKADISGETDSDGVAHLAFVADADFLGDGVIRAADVTYGIPIFLLQELPFFAHTPTDGEKQGEQAAENGMRGHQPLSLGQNILFGAETDMATGISQNSGTIVTIDPKEALTRAGP
ncbi:MAG: hypothetical protein WAW00_03460 [Candidatus Moraniibacteriota bacterium]